MVVTVSIGGGPDRAISPYLASMSLVYSWAPDAVYGNASRPNSTMADWARKHRLATARYPGGEASYWNWEDPSGVMGRSTLDPAFTDAERAPPHLWMSLDEYLDLCAAAALRPLIGVNYNCHRNPWVPRDASVARAVRQVRHVLKRGFPGALWYIGNEDAALGDAEALAAHARAMRAVDPTAKIFFNENAITPASLERFLNEVGNDVFDGVEFHGKWPYGSHAPLPPATFAEWLEEVPLIERTSGQTWRDKVGGMRALATKLGRPDFLLANNEYGLGHIENLVGFNKYTKSLVVVELALEMFVAGYDVAAFWDNGDGGLAANADRMLLSTAAGYRFNPMVIGLEMLASAANQTYLAVTTTQRRVHGFAARAAAAPFLRLYLLNKLEAPQAVRIQLPAGGAPLLFAEAMVDTDDHWGTRRALDVSCDGGVCEATLPPLSFTMLSSDDKAPAPGGSPTRAAAPPSHATSWAITAASLALAALVFGATLARRRCRSRALRAAAPPAAPPKRVVVGDARRRSTERPRRSSKRVVFELSPAPPKTIRRNGFGPLDDEAEPSDDGEESACSPPASEVEPPPPRRPILLDSYRHDDGDFELDIRDAPPRPPRPPSPSLVGRPAAETLD